MRNITKDQSIFRLRTENGWWNSGRVDGAFADKRRRAYFDLLWPLVTNLSLQRAVLLMGPRRVGKTWLIHHVIQALLESGVDARRICYVSVDHPLYNGCSLEDLLALYRDAVGLPADNEPIYLFFDEIQYLRDWEIHLKNLVDAHPRIKFLASGSAAAALRLKSIESGAGRFTDFLLPPLTFHEYLDLLEKSDLVEWEPSGEFCRAKDIAALNAEFVKYLNFGGYPEAIFSPDIQSDPARFIKSDIIDKVLLRDLPSLYGIEDIRELNYLFTTIAFNTADEISLKGLSERSGVAKNTIKRYIEYLEAAFLIKVVHRVDRSGRRFQRANFFKVYLTNPSIRSALFSPIGPDDQAMGPLAETGVMSQWFHDASDSIHYARWDRGEVDIVQFNAALGAAWAVEVKWSDRYREQLSELRPVAGFCAENGLSSVTVTSRSYQGAADLDGVRIEFVPASVYCLTAGRNVIKGKRRI